MDNAKFIFQITFLAKNVDLCQTFSQLENPSADIFEFLRIKIVKNFDLDENMGRTLLKIVKEV
jgi:hypothetical protein